MARYGYAVSTTTAKSGRDGGIRTHDPLTPSQVRYQAALHPEMCVPLRRRAFVSFGGPRRLSRGDSL